MEYYYGMALTPELFNQIHEIGYLWVKDLHRYNLLMISIQRRGAGWEEAQSALENPKNIKAYKNGPSPREAWIEEVDTLNRSRAVHLDWSKLEHLTWGEKMRLEQEMPDNSISDAESLDIHDKWLAIWSGNRKW
tara:strand:+ start:303 stop:704 length:402 start_codon:yes stop_codon:yes gene_type:complete